MAVSTSGGVACRVSYRRMVDIWNTSSTGCRYLYSSIVVCCRRYKRWTICRSATYDFFSKIVCLRQSCWSYVALSSVLSVHYEKNCIKFASHHLLLYVVYMCQKSLNFTYAFKCYQQKCKWFHFSWATMYTAVSSGLWNSLINNGLSQIHKLVFYISSKKSGYSLQNIRIFGCHKING